MEGVYEVHGFAVSGWGITLAKNVVEVNDY